MAGRTVQDAKRELIEKGKLCRRLFETSDGKAVLELLEARFNGGRSVRPAQGAPVDPYQLAINEGAREPMRWVRELMAFSLTKEGSDG